MNTNAVAYKKIGDSIKKRFKKTKFHKDNPNMFKGGDVKIHPNAKKDSSKDSPKNKKAKLKKGKTYTKAQLRFKERQAKGLSGLTGGKKGETISEYRARQKKQVQDAAKKRNADFKKARKEKLKVKSDKKKNFTINRRGRKVYK